MSATMDKVVKVKVPGTVERVLSGHIPDPKVAYDRFRPWPRVSARPRVVRRKKLLGRENTAFGRPFTFTDSLWNLVGIAGHRPGAPTDVSSNKHKYLAESYDQHKK